MSGALLANQLPVYTPKKAVDDGSNTWALLPETTDEALGSWIQPGPAPTAVVMWRMSHSMEDKHAILLFKIRKKSWEKEMGGLTDSLLTGHSSSLQKQARSGGCRLNSTQNPGAGHASWMLQGSRQQEGGSHLKDHSYQNGLTNKITKILGCAGDFHTKCYLKHKNVL